jgi:predicted transcriptional regulator of viral defense system
VSWGALARAQAGVISRRQLLTAGVTRDQVDGLLAGGALTILARGVFLVRGAPETYDARLWAAVLGTGGLLGFATAAHLWGVVDSAPGRIAVVLSPDRRSRRCPGVRVHRVPVPPKHRQRRNGLPVTSRTWTLLDHLGELRFDAGCTLADRALQRGWLTVADIERRLADWPGRSGNAVLRRLMSVVGDGAAAQSERTLHAILRGAGLTGWVANYPVWHNGVLLGVADVAFPGAGLVIEVDGMAFHTTA